MEISVYLSANTSGTMDFLGGAKYVNREVSSHIVKTVLDKLTLPFL